MDQLVLAAGTALVAAMASDGWQQARAGVVALWRRIHPDRTPAVEAELDDVRGEVLAARQSGDAEAEAGLIADWQRRLRRLLATDPGLASELRRVLDEQWIPLLPAAERARVQSIMVTASGSGRPYQAGRDNEVGARISVGGSVGGQIIVGDNNISQTGFLPASPAKEKHEGEVGSAASHRAIVCVDIEGFGDRRRTSPHHIAARAGLYGALRVAFDRGGVGWLDCSHEDRGDGALILVPPELPKSLLVTGVLRELAAELRTHNVVHSQEARIRLRMAVHAGEVRRDQEGVSGTAVNTTFRLLEAKVLKQILARSTGTLAVVVSQPFFEEVNMNSPASAPESYRQIRVSVKETKTTAWVGLPDAPWPDV